MTQIQTAPSPEDPSALLENLVLVSDGFHDNLGLTESQQQAEVAQLNELFNYAPRVIAVAERPEDQESRLRAERIFARVGEMALGTTIEIEKVPEPPMTLKEAIDRAANGDEESHKMVRANVKTEATEMLYKAANVTEVTLDVDKQGRTIQFGQTSEDFNLNTLAHASRHEKIAPRSRAEARNSMRIEDLKREGLLKDNYFVVLSLCFQGLSDKELDELNCFSETYSMSLQALTEVSDAQLSLESAFIAGIAKKDGNYQRHDRQAVIRFGEKLGVDLSGLDEVELTDFPLLVPKEMMSDGAIDLAALMDECVEEVIGEPVFYGEAKPKQDYKEHRALCREREKNLEAYVDSATTALVREAPQISDPIHATKRLNKIVQAEMLKVATEDHTIDARVFGKKGAPELQVARTHWLNGDAIGMQTALFRANKVATGGSSCPTANARKESESTSQDSGGDQSSEDLEENCKEVKDGDVVNCPFCKEEVVAIVRGDDIFCSNPDCKAAHSSVKGK